MLIFLSILESDSERQQFIGLYERYGNALLRIARKILGSNQNAAEDAVQSAWLRAIEHFSRLQEVPADKQGAYLAVIVRNEALTILRRQKKELLLDEETADSVTAEPESGSVLETIQKMPETYRVVLELRFVEGYGTREIAQRLQMTEGAVNTRICRGRQLLLKRLEEEGYTV